GRGCALGLGVMIEAQQAEGPVGAGEVDSPRGLGGSGTDTLRARVEVLDLAVGVDAGHAHGGARADGLGEEPRVRLLRGRGRVRRHAGLTVLAYGRATPVLWGQQLAGPPFKVRPRG